MFVSCDNLKKEEWLAGHGHFSNVQSPALEQNNKKPCTDWMKIWDTFFSTQDNSQLWWITSFQRSPICWRDVVKDLEGIEKRARLTSQTVWDSL